MSRRAIPSLRVGLQVKPARCRCIRFRWRPSHPRRPPCIPGRAASRSAKRGLCRQWRYGFSWNSPGILDSSSRLRCWPAAQQPGCRGTLENLRLRPGTARLVSGGLPIRFRSRSASRADDRCLRRRRCRTSMPRPGTCEHGAGMRGIGVPLPAKLCRRRRRHYNDPDMNRRRVREPL